MSSLYVPIGAFPPTYFPPTYFPVGSGSLPIGTLKSIAGDPEILDDIVDRIRATNAFYAVEWGFPINDPIPADMIPCAVVEPGDWQETDTFDADVAFKDTRFTVTIATKAGDPRESQAQALQLSSVVVNAINRKQLAGVTWVPWTRIRQGRFDRRRHPESRLILTGTYRVEINRSYNHHEDLDTSGE